MFYLFFFYIFTVEGKGDFYYTSLMYFYCHNKRKDMLVRKFRLCPAHPTTIGPPACKGRALIVNGLKYIQLKFRI